MNMCPSGSSRGDILLIRRKGNNIEDYHYAVNVGDGIVHLSSSMGIPIVERFGFPNISEYEVKVENKTTNYTADEICRRALSKVERNDELWVDSKYFADWCRYGVAEPGATGDLIIFKRDGYKHYGVFIGYGYVVHLSAFGETENDTIKDGKFICCSNAKKSKVVVESFGCALRSRDVISFESTEPSLKTNQICERALQWKDKTCSEKLWTSCKHFAHWCRYGDKLQPARKGDLIVFHRSVGNYSHYAVYVGDGNIIHLAASREGRGAKRDSPPIACCSSTSTDIAGIIKENFENACLPGDEIDFVRNKSPFTPEEICNRAEDRVGESGYCLIEKNCEHFARWCRFDKNESEQVYKAVWSICKHLLLANIIVFVVNLLSEELKIGK